MQATFSLLLLYFLIHSLNDIPFLHSIFLRSSKNAYAIFMSKHDRKKTESQGKTDKQIWLKKIEIPLK